MIPSTTRHLFVIRMWQEADAVTATIQWRSSIQHGQNHERHYFTQLADLLAFIATRTESASAKPIDLPQAIKPADDVELL